MKVKVRFLASYRDLFQGKERVVDLPHGALLGHLLRLLSDSAERKTALFRNDETISPHVVILKNGIPVPAAGGLASALAEDDVIAIFPFLGGG